MSELGLIKRRNQITLDAEKLRSDIQQTVQRWVEAALEQKGCSVVNSGEIVRATIEITGRLIEKIVMVVQNNQESDHTLENLRTSVQQALVIIGNQGIRSVMRSVPSILKEASGESFGSVLSEIAETSKIEEWLTSLQSPEL